MPIATLAFDFDPILRLPADIVVRWQTLALAALIAGTLVVAGLIARRAGLRADDLLYVAVGIVPGAVIGGRLGYGIAHAETFASDPLRLLDPAVPGADLGLAVVGGVLTGAYVVALLGAPLGRWAHVLALPLLVAIGGGKLAMILGGSGQGLPSDAAWATAFLGPGPWGSLAPELPAHPAQAYEGLATLGWAVLLVAIASLDAFRRRDGRLLLVGVAGWAAVRALTSVTWRDPAVLGPLGMAGAMAAAIAVAAVLAAVVLTLRSSGRQSAGAGSAAPDAELSWPDPEARPRF